MTQPQAPQVPANLNSLDAKLFREALMNFAYQIQTWCEYLDFENDYDSIKDQVNSLENSVDSLQKSITENNESMQNKINSILLGTDVPSVEIVVEQILKDKGVI